MPLTLEMPNSDTDLFSSSEPPAESESAKSAAELIDQAEVEGDAEMSEVDPPTDLEGQLGAAFNAADEQAAAEPPANDKPKRGRKKKQPKAENAEQQPEQQNAGSGQPDESQSDQVTASPPSGTAENSPAAAPETIKVTATYVRTPQASDLLDEISRAETKCAASERSVLLLKEELKEAKKEYDADVQALRKLCRALENDKSRPLFDPHKLPTEAETAASAAADCNSAPLDTNHPSNEAEEDAPKQNPNAWRSVSISVLGLSPKLEEKLCDGYPAMTLGALEDLRAEISQGRARWPKGIGQARITEIENAIVDWLTENRDKATFAELGDGKVQQSQQLDLRPTEAVEYPGLEAWEAMSDSAQAEYFGSRVKQINDGTADCLARKHPGSDRFYESGFAAYSQVIDGKATTLTDCPYVPGDEADDWLRGFVAAKIVNEYDPGEKLSAAAAKAEVEPEQPQQQAATASTGIDLDDL